MVVAQHVRICDSHIKQEPPNILVVFPSFLPNAIVLPELVVAINPTHVLVVQVHRLRANNIASRAISPLACYSGRLGWVRDGSNNHHRAIVLPHTNGKVLVLLHPVVTPLSEPFLYQRLQVFGEALAVAAKSATTIQSNLEEI